MEITPGLFAYHCYEHHQRGEVEAVGGLHISLALLLSLIAPEAFGVKAGPGDKPRVQGLSLG